MTRSTTIADTVAEPPSAVDTSVLVAAHVAGHEHRELAAAPTAASTHVLGPVLVETWSVLRRHFRIPAIDVGQVLRAYAGSRQIVAPEAPVYDRILEQGPGLGLSGNVHDFVIAQAAATHGLRLFTLDRGMERFAGADVRRVGR